MTPAQNISPLKQLLIFIGLILGGFLLTQLLSIFCTFLFLGISGMAEMINAPFNHIPLLKSLQILQALCLFILPAYLFCKLTGNKVITYFNFDKKIKPLTAIIIIISIVAAIPFINLLGDINSRMIFPPFLSHLEEWMQNTEERAANLTLALVSGDSITALFINLLMIAILPAISEEVVFRGILQPIIIKNTRNVHIAIVLTAIFFSAFHLQFYGFLPRFFLGIILGYMYVTSGSLWLPILAHFTNNAMATLFYFLYNKGIISSQLDTLGTEDERMIGVLSGGILLIVFFFLERHKTTLHLNELK